MRGLRSAGQYTQDSKVEGTSKRYEPRENTVVGKNDSRHIEVTKSRSILAPPNERPRRRRRRSHQRRQTFKRQNIGIVITLRSISVISY